MIHEVTVIEWMTTQTGLNIVSQPNEWQNQPKQTHALGDHLHSKGGIIIYLFISSGHFSHLSLK